MALPRLYIGNKRYSSWSLRGWLALKYAHVPFEETVIPLDTDEFHARIGPLSPMRTVPALHVDGRVIWDSLAIAEWAAEHAQDLPLWPTDPGVRAEARALAATMHSGFTALRSEAPMNLGRESKPRAFVTDAFKRDVERIQEIWRDHRDPCGPYFYGAWSLVDAFWAPVATRFRSYGVELEPVAQAYVDVLLADPHYRAWRAEALAETYDNKMNDDV